MKTPERYEYGATSNPKLPLHVDLVVGSYIVFYPSVLGAKQSGSKWTAKLASSDDVARLAPVQSSSYCIFAHAPVRSSCVDTESGVFPGGERI